MRNRRISSVLKLKEPKLQPEEHDTDDNDIGIEETFESGMQELLDFGHKVKELYCVNAEQLLAMAKDQPDFLIPGLIPASSLLMMQGKPGEKKSWIAYSLVLALAQNKPWLDVMPEQSKKKRRALVLNFDNPAFELGRRFKRLGLRAEDEVIFHSIGLEMPPMHMPALLQLPLCIEPIIALVYATQPSLILIDSMRQSHTGDESSSEDMGRLMSCLRQLTHWGASVLVLHHTRKSDVETPDDEIEATRGSSAIAAALDGLLTVRDSSIRLSKTRLWEPAVSTRRFSVTDEGNTTRVETPDGVAVRVLSVIKLAGDDGISRQDLCRQLGVDVSDLSSPVGVLLSRKCIERNRARGKDGKQSRKFRYLKDLTL